MIMPDIVYLIYVTISDQWEHKNRLARDQGDRAQSEK